MVDGCQVLASVRVLDLGDAETDLVGRLLADLGADVLKVEPPGGAPARAARPSVSGAGIAFTLHNANKRSAILDPAVATDRDLLLDLAASADILIDGRPGTAAYGDTGRALADRFPHLVVLAVSDFGGSGPHAHWCATDAVLYAMSTALSRSGPTAGRPVLPPSGIASATAAVQATWAALVSYYRRIRCGTGDYIDLSRFEAVLSALDPPFGSEGQAAVGLKASTELWRGRPRNQQIYPTFRCRDGVVRVCLLSGRQWKGMFGWLGEPEAFAGPEFATIAARYAASRQLNAAMADLFGDQCAADLVAEGQRRGVPIASVQTPAEALTSEHFRAVGALTEVEFAPGAVLPAPTGPFVVDGRHAGVQRPCPAAGADAPRWARPARPEPRPGPAAPHSRPLEGLRILDLGVIVAGGELGRLFADLGAHVVKVESAAYPDGLRQAPPGRAMSRSWALTHRNEYSLGLDLRHAEGAALFGRLVADSDAVFANFKPGTLDSLGFSFADLRRLNPRIVLAESSAFGAEGPWSTRMGYGPLVRAATGVSGLWRAEASEATSAEPEDEPDDTLYDATTIFPDHVSARITAIAALAAIIARTSTNTGAHVHISQAEVAVNQLAAAYVAAAADAAHLPVQRDPGYHGVHPCAGDDEWCVISLRSAADRAAAADVIGVAALPVDRTALSAAIAQWTVHRDKHEVAQRLQAAGVPAAPMYRAADVLTDPQLAERGVYGELTHPLFDAAMPSERRTAVTRGIPDAAFGPAPMPGEHTREICSTRLGLADADIDRLIHAGVLFEWSPAVAVT